MASTIRNLTVSFGLVEFPASLRKASEKKDVTFDSAVEVVEGEGRKRKVSYEPVVQHKSGGWSGATTGTASNGTPGPRIVKGVWVDETTFRPLPEGALEQITADTQIAGIEIEEFIPLKDAPIERIEGAYYLTPQKGLIGAKPMRLLRDALKAEKAAGLAKLTLKGSTGRQRLGLIHESDGKLVINLLAFAADFRDADESAQAVENVVVDRAHLALARDLVKARTVDGATSKLLNAACDDAVAAREKLYLDAHEGEIKSVTKPKATPERTPGDLMAALEASLEQQKSKAKRKAVTA